MYACVIAYVVNVVLITRTCARVEWVGKENSFPRTRSNVCDLICKMKIIIIKTIREQEEEWEEEEIKEKEKDEKVVEVVVVVKIRVEVEVNEMWNIAQFHEMIIDVDECRMLIIMIPPIFLLSYLCVIMTLI